MMSQPPDISEIFQIERNCISFINQSVSSIKNKTLPKPKIYNASQTKPLLYL